jgi:hypothetical protein
LIYRLTKVNHGGRYKCGDGIVGAVAAGVAAVAVAAGVAAVAAAAAGARTVIKPKAITLNKT